MKLSEKQKNYLPLVPPIDKHFADMSKQEAQDYFNWFISHIDERADYLRNKVSKGLGIPIDLIDYSLESMKPVWEWFLQVAEVEKIPKRDLKVIEKSMAGLPQNVRERLIKQSSIRLDLFTEFVLKDIGMYVSSFFIKNYPDLEWIFKRTPKNYVHVNQPLLYGFKDNSIKNSKLFELEPINFVELRAVKLLRDVQPLDDDLYIACKEWAQWAPKKSR